MIDRFLPTPEQFPFIQGSKPAVIVDASGKATHVVLPVDDARRLLDEHYRRELEPAFAQADAGQVEPWDIESTLAKARSKYPSDV